MDRVSRLIVVLFSALSAPAFSAPTYGSVSNINAAKFRNMASACLAAGVKNSSPAPYNVNQYQGLYYCGAGSNTTVQVYTQTCGPGQSLYVIGTLYGQTRYECGSCPSGQASYDGYCAAPVSCPSNKERDPETNTCECKSIYSAGSFMVTGDVYKGCNDGCSMVLQSGWYDKTANTTWGKWSQTSGACSAGEPSVLSASDPKVEAAKQCAAGTCPGTVNGQSVCVPCDKTKQTTGTTKTESASETPSGASVPASSDSSSEETSEQTECKDGTCTTNKKTVGVGPDGNKTEKNEQTVQPQSKYCEANPKAAVCKGTDSSWGGSCDGFTCDGDPVQCAQAKGAWDLACTLKTDATSSVVQTGLQAVGGTLSDAKPVETTASIGQFNTQNPYTGTCPQDVTVSVAGKTFTIPLSQTCSWIQAIGWFLVAGATLAGARIAFT